MGPHHHLGRVPTGVWANHPRQPTVRDEALQGMDYAPQAYQNAGNVLREHTAQPAFETSFPSMSSETYVKGNSNNTGHDDPCPPRMTRPDVPGKEGPVGERPFPEGGTQPGDAGGLKEEQKPTPMPLNVGQTIIVALLSNVTINQK